MTDRSLAASIRFNSALLAVFAAVTTGLLAFTFASTQERIEQQKQKARLAALSEILPVSEYDNDLIMEGVYPIPDTHWAQLNLKEASNGYIATKNRQPVAIIFPTIATGYSGDIRLLVGVFADGTVAGVRVTEHAETPGLGDYIERRKSDWILMFNGRSLDNPAIKRWDTHNYNGEFDSLTSATISSRGVIRQVKAALQYFADEDPIHTLPALAQATNDGALE